MFGKVRAFANSFIQTHKYDSLYRLTEARETSNSAQTWKQNFSFDRYGNRLTHEKFAGTTQLSLTVPEHPTIETATNRLSSGQGFTFDANGNLIVDADNRGFTFNGDNKQTVVRNLNITPPQQDPDANVIARYFYDGEGKRIKKVSATETTVFVYSAGKLIAEYSTATPPSNPTTSWTVTDQLGSPRVIVNSLGAVVSRRDFMPFGEELDADETYRKTLHKYGQTDSVRQKFTGYQNDTETGLDFAEARMYQNLHGRFTAIDPLLASGKSANPQTFNRYVYVMNRPLILTDPTGLQAGEKMKVTVTVSPRSATERITYPVSGKTDVEAWNDAKIQGPKKHGGQPKAGRYEFFIKVSTPSAPGTYVTNEDGSVTANVTVSDLVVTVTDKYTVPEWSNRGDEGIPDSERKEWDDESSRLESHEKGHVPVTDGGVKDILVPALEGLAPITGTGTGTGSDFDEAKRNAFQKATEDAMKKIQPVINDSIKKIQERHNKFEADDNMNR